MPDNQYIFFVSVCRMWRNIWPRHHGSRKVTRAVTVDTTVSQLQFSIDWDLPRTPKVCTAIAKLGRLDLLQCARQNGLPWDKSTCSAAARGGHYDVLTWAWMHACPFDEDTLCSDAARGGNLDALIWTSELEYSWKKDAICNHIARSGKIERSWTGCATTTVPWKSPRVLRLRVRETWKCCSGSETLIVRGMNVLVPGLPVRGILRY